jgi:predicted dienelactone hydrolase
MGRLRSISAPFGALMAVLGLALGTFVASPAPAGGQTSYERGPDPTDTTIYEEGPFSVSQVDASGGLGGGFNNVTIYYPDDTSEGTFAGIVLSPGFVSPKSWFSWAGPKIASHGFVVAIMETNSLFDFPNARRDQMQAVMQFLSGSSAPAAVRERLDTNRLGAMGHSMGGGGALQVATQDNPDVDAVVALQPFDPAASYSSNTTPAMIIGASNDLIASPGVAAEPYYNQINNAEKQYVELSGQGHLVAFTDNPIQSAVTIAWFKRFLDNDTRYTQFLCPPVSGQGVAETRDTCPY